MSRSVAWRRICSDACSWFQDQALNTTMLIMRQTGPTGFLLKEDGEAKCFKVFLGDPNTCTCPTFKKERDLCKHICWVILKKFRVPRQNPVTWQLGLVEREINEILSGSATAQVRPSHNGRALASSIKQAQKESSDESGTVAQREITADDVCPICQEELLEKRLPVTYCKFGCGNSIHIKCMGVWANHQRSTNPSDSSIKCPMCREDFGPFSLLQREMNTSHRETMSDRKKEHLGVKCQKCGMCPILGKCYRCIQCHDYHLCQSCFNSPEHSHHQFSFRERPNQRWRPAPRSNSAGLLPDAVAQQLMSRDLTENDYDLLLQLDSQSNQPLSDLTESTVHSFPLETIRHNSVMLAPGNQCRVCLRGYHEGEQVRRLPCRHKFHKDCIDNWLLHRHATCPVDGTVFTNESVRNMRESSRNRGNHGALHDCNNSRHTQRTTLQRGSAVNLEIPGVGLARIRSHPSTDQERSSTVHRRASNPSCLRRLQDRQQSLENVLDAIRSANESASHREVTMSVQSAHGDVVEEIALDGTSPVGLFAAENNVQGTDIVTDSEEVVPMSSTIEQIPVPPSIPACHGNIDLSVGDSQRNNSAASVTRRKPPSGFRGRHRGNSRLAPAGHVPPTRSTQLYVGHDPRSIAGFASHYQLEAPHPQRPAPLRSRDSRSGQSEEMYRWGHQREADMVLSGNALSGLTLNDAISDT